MVYRQVTSCGVMLLIASVASAQRTSVDRFPAIHVARVKNIAVQSVQDLRGDLGIDLWRIERLSADTLKDAMLELQYEDLAEKRAAFEQLMFGGAQSSAQPNILGLALSQQVQARGLLRTPQYVAGIPTGPMGALPPVAPGINPARWVGIGPNNVGGRTRCIVVDRSDPNVLWLGSVGGGVWRSGDRGHTFSPVDDHMANLSISCLAQSPANPLILVAGTGEAYGNIDRIRGDGIFWTVDGVQWRQLPHTDTADFRFVAGLAFDNEGKTLLAASSSSDRGGQQGIYRSTSDARDDLTFVFSADVSGIRIHPTDSRKAVAGSLSSGQSFYTEDNGLTWKVSTHTDRWTGRVEVTYARANPDIVYASVSSYHGLIYRSTDGGKSFARRLTTTPDGRRGGYLGDQGWYGNCIWADDPTNANLLIVGGVDLWRSVDGGQNIIDISSWYDDRSPHADHHALATDRGYNGVTNRRVYFGNDGGIAVTDDIAKAGNDRTLPRISGWTRLNEGYVSSQFYGGCASERLGLIIGGLQDNGTWIGRHIGTDRDWTELFGGDGGACQIDDVGNYAYGEYVYGSVHRADLSTISKADFISGNYYDRDGRWKWKDQPYVIGDARDQRGNFIAPIILDPNEPNRLLVGLVSLWRTNDARTRNVPYNPLTGPKWTAIKPEYTSPISAIAIQPGNSDVIWVAHNDGAIFKTVNGTAPVPNWMRIATPVGFPQRFCTRIVIDPRNHDIVYATFGEFFNDNVWRSSDGGGTWMALPTGPVLAPVRSLAIHPDDSNFLYIGTEVGIFTSENGGTTWIPTNQGPTNCSVFDTFWMGKKLIVATHGRGMFSIDLSGAQ